MERGEITNGNAPRRIHKLSPNIPLQSNDVPVRIDVLVPRPWDGHSCPSFCRVWYRTLNGAISPGAVTPCNKQIGPRKCFRLVRGANDDYRFGAGSGFVSPVKDKSVYHVFRNVLFLFRKDGIRSITT